MHEWLYHGTLDWHTVNGENINFYKPINLTHTLSLSTITGYIAFPIKTCIRLTNFFFYGSKITIKAERKKNILSLYFGVEKNKNNINPNFPPTVLLDLSKNGSK